MDADHGSRADANGVRRGVRAPGRAPRALAPLQARFARVRRAHTTTSLPSEPLLLLSQAPFGGFLGSSLCLPSGRRARGSAPEGPRSHSSTGRGDISRSAAWQPYSGTVSPARGEPSPSFIGHRGDETAAAHAEAEGHASVGAPSVATPPSAVFASAHQRVASKHTRFFASA